MKSITSLYTAIWTIFEIEFYKAETVLDNVLEVNFEQSNRF